jgi:hypothetical protein
VTTYEERVAEYIRLLTIEETEAAERLWAELEPEREARYRASIPPRRRIPKREPSRFELHRCPANPSGEYQPLTIQQIREAGFVEEASACEREPNLAPLFYSGVRIKDEVMENARIKVALGCCRHAEIYAALAVVDRRAAA